MRKPSGNANAARHALSRSQQLRRRLAVEAARLIAEHGVRDYQQAKLKAAERLAIFDDGSLPRNSEIEDALREHQRLFQAESQPRALRRLRNAAAEAMRFFAGYEPRLAGAVLDGTADGHSAVCLHLFAENPNEVSLFLRERGIPFDEQSRRLRVTRDEVREFPVLRFAAEDTAIDLTVLPPNGLRQAPLDRNERPMRRISLAVLEALIAEDEIAEFEGQRGAGET